MDTAGAILGSLSALALLPLCSGNIRKVYWLAAIPGAVCILLVWLGVSEVHPVKVGAHGHAPLPAGTSSWNKRLVFLGYSTYGAVYLGFSLARGPQFVWLLFAVNGTYYAMTEGVLRAWIADLVPSSSRGLVFGAFNWLVGMVALPASLLAGWLWRFYSPPVPFFISAVLSSAAALLLLLA
jgi:hypothetical protein